MQLAFLTHQLSRSAAGLQTAMIGLASALAERHHQVCAIGLGDAAAAELSKDWGVTQCQAFPPSGPRALGYHGGMKQALEQQAPELIHQHGLWTYSSLLGKRWGARHGQRRIVSPHGMLDDWAMRQASTRKRVAMALYERASLAQAGCIHALVDSEARAIRDLGIDAPICVIPNGFDTELAKRNRALAQQDAARPASIQAVVGDKPYLLYLGRIHAKKNLDQLLNAWANVHQAKSEPSPDWQFVMAGWGEPADEAHLRQRLETDHSALSRCHFVGPAYDEQKQGWYQHASGFALPSLSEGLPMVILEAWSYGLPVLMTDECNLSLAFAAGAALRIDAKAPGIAPALTQLMQMSDEQRREMGNRGASLLNDRYTWQAVAAQFEAVYEWLLTSRADSTRPDSVDWATA
ncbi:MAG: glycosyltransferase [Burkholderiaceae bacterium]